MKNTTSANQKMIDIFKCLSPMQQGELIGRAQHMAEQNEKQIFSPKKPYITVYTNKAFEDSGEL